MLYYAALTDPNNNYIQGIYSPEEYLSLTFCPETKTRYITAFKAKNKEEAREIAKGIQYADIETNDNNGEQLSYGEWGIICAGLEKLARRFGLVREFKNEGLI